MRFQAQGAPVVSAAGAPWRALLSGDLRDRALQLVDVIVDQLSVRHPHEEGGSLSGGSAGLAVCFAVLSRTRGELFRTRGEAVAADRARALLDEAIGALGSQPLSASFYAGFPGIAWAAELVDRLLEEADEDRNEEIDAALLRLVRRYPGEEAPYDLIHGLTGLGGYALARSPRPAAEELLAAVVDQLARRARRDGDGVCWWTPPSSMLPERRQMYPHGGVDLGVAHGISGVLPLLARAQALGTAREVAGELLEGAVGWLQAHLVDTPAGPTVPYFIAEDVPPGPARLAWCYGDPGVATALLLAARDAGRPDWADLALTLAAGAAARPVEGAGVTDAGLCHGTAGLAHLFNRMHQLTGRPELADAARSWIERTLDMCDAAGQAGQTADGAAPRPWTGPGLLEGAAGVVVALLAAATPVEPVWDAMLLVSTGASDGGTAR